ncbi:hypothetical protein [Variovorax sp. WS11]|uniref:hypothetical protein n=1 Tax=Variovorax sp. WS11 TaxID=1105204 RepID=UPI0013D9F170|nr:hypothetical protein [Variovorax sp. WS11]NDZ12871.1 hypothetical protein [Variovorax sp. WS11]
MTSCPFRPFRPFLPLPVLLAVLLCAQLLLSACSATEIAPGTTRWPTPCAAARAAELPVSSSGPAR